MSAACALVCVGLAGGIRGTSDKHRLTSEKRCTDPASSDVRCQATSVASAGADMCQETTVASAAFQGAFVDFRSHRPPAYHTSPVVLMDIFIFGLGPGSPGGPGGGSGRPFSLGNQASGPETGGSNIYCLFVRSPKCSWARFGGGRNRCVTAAAEPRIADFWGSGPGCTRDPGTR